MTQLRRLRLLTAALVLALLAVSVAGAAEKLTRAQREAEKKLVAQLPEPYRIWLEEVEILITPQEKTAFLKLEKDYQRDAFIDRFWEVRDPYPDTTRNEFRENWEQRLDIVRHDYGGMRDDRARMLMLNGNPDALIRARCAGMWPLEIWYFDGSSRSRDKFFLVFVQTFGQGLFRIWQPFDQRSLADLFQFAPPNGNVNNLVEEIGTGCGVEGDTVRAAVLTVLRTNPLDYTSLVARLEQPLEKPLREWVETFNSTTTDVTTDASFFKADFSIGFPARRQSRTVVQGLVKVATADAALSDFGDVKRYDFLITGEVLRGKKLFESFRYKYGFTAAEIAGDKIPLVFERTLRPGDYTMIVKVEDLNGKKFYRHQEELVVPGVEGPDILPPKDSETAKILAESNAAISAGEDTIKIIPPSGELQAGMLRIDTLTTGTSKIAQVIFTLDGKPILTKRNPPYSVELDFGTLPKTHMLRVVSKDDQGNDIASDERQLNGGVNRFAVRFVEPRPGKAYAESLRAEVKVEVPDGDIVQRVEFFLNETPVATLYQPPFVQPIVLGKNPVGYVRAVAYLPDGNSTERVVFINMPDLVEEVSVQYVELFATVIDKAGKTVQGLTQKDFSVKEDDRPQSIVRFEKVENLPMHVEILLDTSASMTDRLDRARAAALQFFQQTLTPKDRAAVVTFNDRPQLQVKLTNDLSALAAGLVGLKAERGTSLYDAVIFSLYYMNGVKGQRALLILSDGKDENSRFTFPNMLEYARRAGVAIYPIGLGFDKADRETKKQLEKLADETGGRSFFTADVEQLDGIYAQIQTELRSRYLIAYQSNNPATGDIFRSVELKCTPGLEAKTIRGYYP